MGCEVRQRFPDRHRSVLRFVLIASKRGKLFREAGGHFRTAVKRFSEAMVIALAIPQEQTRGINRGQQVVQVVGGPTGPAAPGVEAELPMVSANARRPSLFLRFESVRLFEDGRDQRGD